MHPQHALRCWPHSHIPHTPLEFKPFIQIVPQQAHIWMLPALIIWGPLYLPMLPWSQLDPVQLCFCRGNGRHPQGLNGLSCDFYLPGVKPPLFFSHLLVRLIPPGDCDVMLNVAGSGDMLLCSLLAYIHPKWWLSVVCKSWVCSVPYFLMILRQRCVL